MELDGPYAYIYIYHSYVEFPNGKHAPPTLRAPPGSPSPPGPGEPLRLLPLAVRTGHRLGSAALPRVPCGKICKA